MRVVSIACLVDVEIHLSGRDWAIGGGGIVQKLIAGVSASGGGLVVVVKGSVLTVGFVVGADGGSDSRWSN
jgi:hypothetical protein